LETRPVGQVTEQLEWDIASADPCPSVTGRKCFAWGTRLGGRCTTRRTCLMSGCCPGRPRA